MQPQRCLHGLDRRDQGLQTLMLLPIRDESSRLRTVPYLVIGLIAINVLAYLVEFWIGSQSQRELAVFIAQFGFIPKEPSLYGAMTSMFLHADFWHLAGNMLFLWIFGDNIEDLLGKVLFIPFYIFCGFSAVMAHIWTNPHSTVPLIGASGAISGVLGAYILSFPQNRITTFYWFWFRLGTFAIPAWVYLGIWFGMQILFGLAAAGSGGAGVAYGAHIGGFVAGALLVLVLPKNPKVLAYYRERAEQPWRED
ncbi:MAG: rhomboid family intramembrane serine protease [Armatimonadetes bacterium]|nr:rhomboid family intramembrane serine protease [Armatimonadota bacterium]